MDILTMVQVAGLVIGTVLFGMLLYGRRGIGGSVGSAVTYLMLGALFFTISFAEAIVGPRLSVAPPRVMLIHMSLMVVAMIFIVFSAIKFMNITR